MIKSLKLFLQVDLYLFPPAENFRERLNKIFPGFGTTIYCREMLQAFVVVLRHRIGEVCR